MPGTLLSSRRVLPPLPPVWALRRLTMGTNVAIDRLAMRAKPPGMPVMHQEWDDLLFMHWPVSADLLRPLVPATFELDTFEGQTWIGITPFALRNLHLTSLPPVPGLNAFDELNVRTYVLYNGVPGIWFFSLDASKLVAVVAARVFFMLPYHRASIEFSAEAGSHHFKLHRSTTPEAEFEAVWHVGLRLRAPDLESLAFFLVERYCYFAINNGQVFQTRIYHAPWILDEALLQTHRSTMISAAGIPEPASEPLAHFSRHLAVEIWPPTPA